MLFNSLTFAAFFLLVFFIYWFLLKNNYKLQNHFLLAASCLFYMAFIPVYITILALTILIDYFAAIQIEKAVDAKKKKHWLVISIISTCLVLFVFKYFNFFNTNFRLIAELFHLQYPIGIINIILPIGLSFHTFQSLSYVIEVYRGNEKAERNFLTYSLYVMFFPQLVAGPIERPQHLLPQFNRARVFDYSFASSGARLILIGYFKKVAIADNIAPLVNGVYASPADYAGFPMIMAAVLFAFQIYCDFSGYSDIAIGTARLLGFNLMRNFDYPFISRNITEFWRRWHISLSSWLRDYIYSPIAIARRDWGMGGVLFALMITFLISGLWHGAGWTFVIYGALHGAACCYDAVSSKFRKKVSKAMPAFIYTNVSILLTFAFSCFAWIFFRAPTISQAFYFIKNMFANRGDYASYLKLSTRFRGMGLKPENLLYPSLFVLLLFAFELLERRGVIEKYFKYPAVKWSFYYSLLLLIVFWGYENKAENFIYFQF